MHRCRAPAPHDPTIVEREVLGPSQLQPAANFVHRGPSPTPQGPTIVERGVPGRSRLQLGRYQTPQSPTIVEHQVTRRSRLQPAAHDTTPAAAQQEPDQHPSTQAVDFSQDAIEPDNPFTRQYIERLEAEIKQREVRVVEDLRILREQRRRRSQANRHRHGPYPGEWPSEPTHPDSIPRMSQLSTEASGDNHDSRSSLASNELYSSRSAHNISRRALRRRNGGIPRSTRARVDTHARYNERASRLETVSLQRRILDGLMLTLNYGANGIFNTLSNGVRRLIRG